MSLFVYLLQEEVTVSLWLFPSRLRRSGSWHSTIPVSVETNVSLQRFTLVRSQRRVLLVSSDLTVHWWVRTEFHPSYYQNVFLKVLHRSLLASPRHCKSLVDPSSRPECVHTIQWILHLTRSLIASSPSPTSLNLFPEFFRELSVGTTQWLRSCNSWVTSCIRHP